MREKKGLSDEKKKIPATNKNMAKWKVFAFNYWKTNKWDGTMKRKKKKSRLRSVPSLEEKKLKKNSERDILGWKTRKNSWWTGEKKRKKKLRIQNSLIWMLE